MRHVSIGVQVFENVRHSNAGMHGGFASKGAMRSYSTEGRHNIARTPARAYPHIIEPAHRGRRTRATARTTDAIVSARKRGLWAMMTSSEKMMSKVSHASQRGMMRQRPGVEVQRLNLRVPKQKKVLLEEINRGRSRRESKGKEA